MTLKKQDKILGLLIAILLLFSIGKTKHAWAQEVVGAKQGVIVDFSGSVTVKKGNRTHFYPARENQIVVPLDEIRTGDGAFCMIMLWDNSSIKMGENSHLLIKRLDYDNGVRQSGFKLFVGKIWSNVTKTLNNKSTFEVEAPYTLAAVKGTTFEVTADKESDEIAVFDGQVDINQGDEWIPLEKEQAAQFDRAGTRSKIGPILREKLNPWQKWNLDVDQKISALQKEDNTLYNSTLAYSGGLSILQKENNNSQKIYSINTPLCYKISSVQNKNNPMYTPLYLRKISGRLCSKRPALTS